MLASDWAADAVGLLRDNAARNGLVLRAEVVRWDDPGLLLAGAPWDVVLAADLLYEQRNADALLDLLPRLGGDLLLAEPGRPFAARFLARWHAELLGDGVYRLRLP